MTHRVWLALAVILAIALFTVSLWQIDPQREAIRAQAANPQEDAPIIATLDDPLAVPNDVPVGDGPEVRIFAASSIAPVLEDIANLYESTHAVDITIVTAASSALARQIEQGAPADLFISANQQWGHYLVDKGLVKDHEHNVLLTNRLALVIPAGAEQPSDIPELHLNIDELTENDRLKTQILRLSNRGRIAICEPMAVPCGIYARQTLETLGIWDQARILPAANAQATLAWVERGEAAGAFVYASELTGNEKVQLVRLVPDALHEAIIYEIAALKDRPAHEEALAFLAFLESAPAQRLLIMAGFLPPNGLIEP
jgi:molybdate transport system substrate-binding protein